MWSTRQGQEVALRKKILLRPELRILSESLRLSDFSRNRSFPAALGWMARLSFSRANTVWLANVYMSLYGRLRLDIRLEHLQIEARKVQTEADINRVSSPTGSRLRSAE